jgi:hypothetical protein
MPRSQSIALAMSTEAASSDYSPVLLALCALEASRLASSSCHSACSDFSPARSAIAPRNALASIVCPVLSRTSRAITRRTRCHRSTGHSRAGTSALGVLLSDYRDAREGATSARPREPRRRTGEPYNEVGACMSPSDVVPPPLSRRPFARFYCVSVKLGTCVMMLACSRGIAALSSRRVQRPTLVAPARVHRHSGLARLLLLPGSCTRMSSSLSGVNAHVYSISRSETYGSLTILCLPCMRVCVSHAGDTFASQRRCPLHQASGRCYAITSYANLGVRRLDVHAQCYARIGTCFSLLAWPDRAFSCARCVRVRRSRRARRA